MSGDSIRYRKRARRSSAPVQRPHGTQFGIIDARIAQDESLPPNVKLVYMYLCSRADTAREAWPSRARMAREIGISVGAVDVAKKVGSACGLWTVEHDYEENDGKKIYSSNVYLLHDHGGSYKPGSGPGARKPGKPRGRHVRKSRGGSNAEPGVAQTLSQGGSTTEPNQYQGSGPAGTSTNHASSGDAPARAPEQARGRAAKPLAKRIHIQKPDAATEKELTRKLVAAGVAAMTRAGKPLGSRGRADIGLWAKNRAATHQVDDLVAAIQRGLQAGLDGDPEFDWLFEDLPKPVSYADTDDALDDLHGDLDGLPGAYATVNRMWDSGYHPAVIANTVNKQLSA